MKKALFNYCKNNLRLINHGKLKVCASLTSLVNDYNVGYIADGFFHFDEKDKQQLVDIVARELNGIRLSDTYPEPQTRDARASSYRDEKQGALKVSEDFVLLNSLVSLRLNKHVIQSAQVSSLGQFICASDIETIEHVQIVLVENLIVMANLSRLNIPDELKDALWLYRGDKQKHKQTGTADGFFKRFKKTNQLLCFSDFDPKGLEIALTCGAIQWLTLAHEKDINIQLSGHESEWFTQESARKYLQKRAILTDSIKRLFNSMNINQKSLKQEHIIAHSLMLRLYPLSK